jgi:hypothetical protein
MSSVNKNAMAPNLLGRHGPTAEQINGTWYSHSYPWDKEV